MMVLVVEGLELGREGGRLFGERGDREKYPLYAPLYEQIEQSNNGCDRSRQSIAIDNTIRSPS